MKTITIVFILVAINVSCFGQQHEMTWQQFEDRINKLEQDSLYSKAMQFLEENREKVKDEWFKLSKEEIYLNEKLGNFEANLAILKDGHDKGYFYLVHPNLPKFKPYVELSGFSEISNRDMELRDKANVKSKMLFDIVTPGNFNRNKSYPVIVIFHGGGSNLKMVKEHWHNKKIDNKFIKIYVQNYLHYDSETFGWRSGDEKAFKKLKFLFSEFQKNFQIQEDKIYVAGMSAGGTFAIDVAVRQVIPITGFITFCPGIPRILGSEHHHEIKDVKVSGYMLGGEKDYYLEKQKQMMPVFDEKEIECHHEIVQDMGHEYPQDESKWIDEALKILRK